MVDSEYRKEPRSLPDSPAQGVSGEVDGEGGAGIASGGSWVSRALIFLMVIAVLVALASAASQWKKEVVVKGFAVDGASIISDTEFLLRMNAFKGRNLQNLDTKELKKRIMTIPYLRDAEIGKELNGIVRVKVFEREAVALAVLDGQIMALDGEGFLLPVRARQEEPLLKISGITRLTVTENGLRKLDQRDVVLIREFLEELSQTDYASLLVNELHLAGNNMTWCLTAQSPARFIVGNDGNYKEKLKKFEIFWQKVVSKKGLDFYETVDLRFRERIFTRDTLPPVVLQSVSL